MLTIIKNWITYFFTPGDRYHGQSNAMKPLGVHLRPPCPEILWTSDNRYSGHWITDTLDIVITVERNRGFIAGSIIDIMTNVWHRPVKTEMYGKVGEEAEERIKIGTGERTQARRA